MEEKLRVLVTALGYEFVGYEFAQENRRAIFRLYIDCPGGISLKDCSVVSRQVSAMLDVEDPIRGKYRLEVSSPGLDRPLFGMEQYQKQLGRRIKIKLYSPIMRRRNFAGVLRRVEDEQIYLLLDEGNEVILPFSEIEKGKVVTDFSAQA